MAASFFWSGGCSLQFDEAGIQPDVTENNKEAAFFGTASFARGGRIMMPAVSASPLPLRQAL